MTTKTIANRPTKETLNNKWDTYRWVARGKTELVAIHVVKDKAYIRRYTVDNKENPSVWKDGKKTLEVELGEIKKQNENPGGGYEYAKLTDNGGNAAGWLLITTGGNAHGKGNKKARLKKVKGQMRVMSKKFGRVNRREYHTLIYRRPSDDSKNATRALTADEETQLSQFYDELEKLKDPANIKCKIEEWYLALSAAACDEPPSDVLLEEEEYEVEAMGESSDLLLDTYFPDEYEYDYEYAADDDPEVSDTAP